MAFLKVKKPRKLHITTGRTSKGSGTARSGQAAHVKYGKPLHSKKAKVKK